MGFLCLALVGCGAALPQVGVPSLRVVEELDVLGNGLVGGFPSQPGPAVDELRLQGPEEALHDRVVPAVPSTAHAALDALDELRRAKPDKIEPDNVAQYPDTLLGTRLRQAAQLIKSKLKVEVICLDSDGWDHHESLPTYLQQSLTELAGSMSAFYTDMGTRMQRITVLVHTEFGRRVAQNASIGTDHGTGGLAYLLGAGVNGGQIISDWPGLAPANLEMGEDLRITTDLRTVLTELLDKRLGGSDMTAVFPGFAGPASANAFL